MSRFKPERGFTILELVITIIILSILSVAVMVPLVEVMRDSSENHETNVAIQLAQERMEFIIGQKHLKGFASFVDPCPGPSICTAPSGYSVNTTISGDWLGDTNYKQVTVTVSGVGDAQLTTLVAAY